MERNYAQIMQKLPVRTAGSVDLAIVAKGKMMGTKQTKFDLKNNPDMLKLESIYVMGSVKPRHSATEKSHGFGHGVDRRDGQLRLSGNKKAHRIGRK
jgi:hypothetical protein